MSQNTKQIVEDLRTQLAAKPTTFLECRTWQHSWVIEKGDVQTEGRHLHWSVPCLRCGTVKTKKISRRDGMSDGAYYSYAEGYVLTGLGRLSREEQATIRQILLERIMG